MGSFVFSNDDVISISISINACFLLQMLTIRLVKWLVPFLSHRCSMGRNLFIVHQRWPVLLGRILTEQITLFILLILILVNLGFVSSPILPFRQHRNSEYHQLTRIVLSASTARFFVIALNVLLASNDVPSCNNDGDFSKINIRGSSGHTKSAEWHFVYCAFSVASNIIGMGFKQNLLLLGTSSFMELNTTSLVICRLIKLADRHRGCQSYFKMSILCCAVCLFSRVLLPGLFLCLALGQETPFVMDVIPMTWFFICACVYFIYHIILVYHSIKRISKASKFSAEAVTHSCQHRFPGNGPFSIYNCSDRLTNDIYGEALLDSEKEGLEDSYPSKPTTKLKDLNYGFLPCYDNRNLCSSVVESEEEKMNFLQKKNSSKHEFIYTFMAKRNTVKNNDTSSYLYYSTGVGASSLTKESRHTTDEVVENSESLNDIHQNYTSDNICSNPNDLTRNKEVDREIKLTEENIGYHTDFELGNLNIEFEQDNSNIMLDNPVASQSIVNSIVIRCHSLPNPDFGALSISEEEDRLPSDSVRGTLETRFVPRWMSNENVYSNPLSFNNIVPVDMNNHSQGSLECQSEICVVRFMKPHPSSVTEDSDRVQSKLDVAGDKFHYAKQSFAHSHNDLNYFESSPS